MIPPNGRWEMKLRFALTDTALRSVKPRAESYKMFDGGGLFVLVKPNGSMLWRYKFKLGGREKLLTLGQYPAVKLADARKLHQDAKIKLQVGVDPSAARQAERAERQVAEAEVALRETRVAGSVLQKRTVDDCTPLKTGKSSPKSWPSILLVSR